MARLTISGRIGNVIHVAVIDPLRSRKGPEGRLLLERDSRGHFHALCGLRVECGDSLELRRLEGS
jgi:hypothetical protein